MKLLKATGHCTMLGHRFDSHSPVSVPANLYTEIESTMGVAGSSSSTVNRSRIFGNDRPTGSGIGSSLSSSASFSVYVEDSTQFTTDNILPKKLTSFTSFTSSSHQHPINPMASSRTENQRPIEEFQRATIPQGVVPHHHYLGILEKLQWVVE